MQDCTDEVWVVAPRSRCPPAAGAASSEERGEALLVRRAKLRGGIPEMPVLVDFSLPTAQR